MGKLICTIGAMAAAKSFLRKLGVKIKKAQCVDSKELT